MLQVDPAKRSRATDILNKLHDVEVPISPEEVYETHRRSAAILEKTKSDAFR